ncbi:MAG: response regulator [Lachnospiraceae bacterium]|nr:response regulator [Lachnospiraceae bacterium]
MKEREKRKSVLRRFNKLAVAIYAVLLFVFCCAGYRLYSVYNERMREERGNHVTEVTGTLAELAELYASSRREMIMLTGSYIDGKSFRNVEEMTTFLEEQNLFFRMEESEVYVVSEDGTYYKSDGTTGMWENKDYLIEHIAEERMWIRSVPGEDEKHLFCWIELNEPVFLESEQRWFEYYTVIIETSHLEYALVSNSYAEKSSVYILGNDGTRLYRQSKIFDIPLSNNYLDELEKNVELLDGEWSKLKEAISSDSLQYCMEISYQGVEYYLATCPVANIPNWNLMVVVDREVLVGSEKNPDDYANLLMWVLIIILVSFVSATVLLLVYLKGKERLSEEQKESTRLLELAAKEANRANRAKTELMAHISHDIRTPIGGVMGMTNIARRSMDDREKVEDCLDKIDESLTYLLSLVNKVLDLSKIESGEFKLVEEPFSIADLLKECVEMMEDQIKENKIWFYKKFPPFAHPAVFGDRLHVKQILMNILGNAMKYTPAGGQVSFFVTEQLTEDGKVEFCFTVQDTGIGMDTEFLKRIYQPYSKADEDEGKRYHGTGLGMTIAKRYIDAMSGTIQVESELGKGSRFIVRIPFVIAEALPKKEETGITVTEAFTGMKILAVEDVPINLKITVFLLEHMGFTVDTALNGIEAVEAFKRSKEGEYAAILMDVMMPEMDGLEATEVIRKLERPDAATIPIVAATASAFEDDRIAIFNAGMNGYLLKPLNDESVYVEMKKQLFPEGEQ